MERVRQAACSGRWGRLGSTCLLLVSATLLEGRTLSQATAPSIDEVTAKIKAGEFGSAESELHRMLKADPASARANFLLGYVLFRERKFTDSLAAYTAGAKSAAPTPDDLVVVASDYIQLRSYPDAERWLTYVTEHDPRNGTAWYLLGRTEYMLDHPDAALRSFEQCLQLKPHDLSAKYNAGLALEHLQRTTDAETAYREAIVWATEQHSSDPQPWLNLGNLLLAQRRFKEAAGVLLTATQKAPANPLCQQQLGVAREGLADYAGAITALRQAVALAPDAERAHFYLARCYRALNHKQEADAEFAIVARLHGSRTGQETPNPDVLAPSNGGEKGTNLD